MYYNAINACVNRMWQVGKLILHLSLLHQFAAFKLCLITNVITSKTAKQYRKRICKQKVSTRLKYDNPQICVCVQIYKTLLFYSAPYNHHISKCQNLILLLFASVKFELGLGCTKNSQKKFCFWTDAACNVTPHLIQIFILNFNFCIFRETKNKKQNKTKNLLNCIWPHFIIKKKLLVGFILIKIFKYLGNEKKCQKLL